MTTDTLTFEPCDQCRAPLDQQQRYCVVCGANRHHPLDPVARYLAAARRPRAATADRAAVAAPSWRGDGRLLATAFALLPVAAAVGVLVGRGGSDESGVVAALRAQKPPIVQLAGAGSGAAASATGGRAARTSAATKDRSRSKGKSASARARAAADDAAVAKKPTQAQKAEGAKVVKQIQAAKGKSYVDQQRNLPDTVVVP